MTPFNLGPNDDGQGHLVLDNPVFDANNSDDIIFGGWDDDFLHGGAGDDAIVGGEALGDRHPGLRGRRLRPSSSRLRTASRASPAASASSRTDWTRPWNPGDILRFGADTNAWHSNHHNASRDSASSCSTTSTTRGGRSCSTPPARRGAARRTRPAGTPAPRTRREPVPVPVLPQLRPRPTGATRCRAAAATTPTAPATCRTSS